ncbi:MAG: tRNA (adenosine(37)-N6)-dimethylallyltransferase MiaA [Pyrinomonadaceae bacterium]
MNNPKENRKPIIAILGPTASGKSGLAIDLALACSGEIINCDSVQVYQGIEIATAKVPPAQRKDVPHHLIDFIPPENRYSAGQWARDGAKTIEEVEARDNLAILVGGSGLYLRALREPFFSSITTDEVLRNKITGIRKKKGAEHLYSVLERLDPYSAIKLNSRDWSRVQRALEVRLQTGQSIIDLKLNKPEPPPFVNRIHIFALNPPREKIYERINARVNAQFARGLVDEVRELLARGVPADSNALGAHGYRRVVEYLQGSRTLESAIEQTKLDVRHYAKRQITWLRRETEAIRIDGFGDDDNVFKRMLNLVNVLREK